jgi:cytochrome c oxidase subunit 1
VAQGGGDPILYQHLFWFYSHPAVYIMVLPAMGVISEIVPTFSHKNTFSYRAIALSTLGIALVGMLT